VTRLPTAIAEYFKLTICEPDPSFVVFVAKIQKAKTRKDKDYYVLRTTVPKEIAEKLNVEPGDFLFFKAKKSIMVSHVRLGSDGKHLENTTARDSE